MRKTASEKPPPFLTNTVKNSRYKPENKKIRKNKLFFKKVLDKSPQFCYNIIAFYGRLAQLGEHLPYKQRVTGSSPVLSTKDLNRDLA